MVNYWEFEKRLKQAFGKVYLNFAEPLILNDYLDQHQPEWHQYRGEANAKPNWLTSQVTALSELLMQRINASVTLNSVSLVALVLLSTERCAIDKKELEQQLDLLLKLTKVAPYSKHINLPEDTSEQLIKQAEKLGTIFHVDNPMGEIVTTNEKTAILLTYYRNNILHIYITAALIASSFLNKKSIAESTLIKNLAKLFPFLQKELFLHWDDDGFKTHIKQNIEVFLMQGLLQKEGNMLSIPEDNHSSFDQIFNLAQIARPTLLRYGIILTLLCTHAGKGNISRQMLESRSQQLAQRIAALYSINAPESFDKNLFRNTVSVLRDSELIKVTEDNQFVINADLLNFQELILNKVNVHSRLIMQKTAAWANDFWEQE